MTPSPPPDPTALQGLRRLLHTVARLRAADGCPWDRQQTMASMAPHLVEEAFEAADALRRGDAMAAREELGDVLVNAALIGQISHEGMGFDLDAAADAAADKLVRRHPHVFGDTKVDGAEAAYRNWERMKHGERQAAGEPRGALAGVPKALPALLRAFRIGEKAARVGFDWPTGRGRAARSTRKWPSSTVRSRPGTRRRSRTNWATCCSASATWRGTWA